MLVWKLYPGHVVPSPIRRLFGRGKGARSDVGQWHLKRFCIHGSDLWFDPLWIEHGTFGHVRNVSPTRSSQQFAAAQRSCPGDSLLGLGGLLWKTRAYG